MTYQKLFICFLIAFLIFLVMKRAGFPIEDKDFREASMGLSINNGGVRTQ